MTGKLLLTPDQVAHLAQVSTRTVMRAIDNGHLRASQLTDRGCWRIHPDDVDTWLEQRANRPRQLQPVTPTPAVGPGRPGRKTGRRISDMLTDDMGRDRAA